MANPSGALWNWSVEGLVAAGEIRAALAAVLARPVALLGVADLSPHNALLVDVWQATGDFPTRVDCYLAPVEPAEVAVVAAFARRLGLRCLLPDDTLDAGRFLLAAPDGTLRPVHLDVVDGDDGPVLSRLRPCTMADQRGAEWSSCRQSRWAPDSVVPGLSAA
ncbi:MAG TPA: hypothetical protein VFX61_04410 [Micromonosporaceae bacterium]|nr:hypothetical protein [Micromonosporaceae bacterium]